MSAASSIICKDDSKRRALARKAPLNGLDYLEVSDDQTRLTAYFLGKAPAWDITPDHLVIKGGRRIRGITVTKVHTARSDREDVDDYLTVTVDRPGDASMYELCIVDVDRVGKRLATPPRDFDPRYACICFSFKASCPSDLDCAQTLPCETPKLPVPVIDYLSKDYASFRRLILDRLALVMPQWRERHIPDFGITLVELLAYVGDHLSYYQDAVATEAYLDTARLRISVRRHVRLVDYRLHEGNNARTWMTISVSQHLHLAIADFYFVAAGSDASSRIVKHADLARTAPARHVVFEPVGVQGKTAVDLYPEHNTIRFYTWGETECCLPKGATSATLMDPGTLPPPSQPDPSQYPKSGSPPGTQREPPDATHYRLRLAPCDVLVFEEVIGPRTGSPADADRARRHAVRLTKVTRSYDPLTQQLLVDIEWCDEDALPFPLCLSSVSVPPDCELVTDVSVARGNVLLADHGETVTDDIGEVPVRKIVAKCDEPCTPAEIEKLPGLFRPRLPRSDVTHSGQVPACTRAMTRCDDSCYSAAASLMLEQDPRTAIPQVSLESYPMKPRELDGKSPGASTTGPGMSPARWVPQLDLLGSGPDDRHVVVEIDDERAAHLRFGDGDGGRQPAAGEFFRARYRVGNGRIGNVGPDTITRMVFRNNLPNGVEIAARNPLAAAGGVEPELVVEAKLRAPYLIRHRLERAVTPADYAAIVRRDFRAHVQRAAAVFRWNGVNAEVLVAIDAIGASDADEELLCRIDRHLQRYRRIGHDLHVVRAEHVPLLLELKVCVKPGHLRAHVKAALLAAFGNRALPNDQRGFFHPDSLTFGEGVFVSRIVALAQSVDGVESSVVSRLERLFEGPNGELEAGSLPLGILEIARLDNDPDFPENGQLLLVLEGGR